MIKWRDIYNVLEETIDAAEDAGEVIERIVAEVELSRERGRRPPAWAGARPGRRNT